MEKIIEEYKMVLVKVFGGKWPILLPEAKKE